MSLTSAIDKIVEEISSKFGAEDAATNQTFKDGVRDACVKNLAGVGSLQPAQAAPQGVTAAPASSKRGPNGYNLFGKEKRQELVKEMGSEEAAKEEFKNRGGITGSWVRDAWHSLSDAEKGVYNSRAKAGRDAVAATAASATQQIVMPGALTGVAFAAVPAKRAASAWQRFQKAWANDLKAQKDQGLPVPNFNNIGERSKACSAAYKEFKDNKSSAELEAYLTLHA